MGLVIGDNIVIIPPKHEGGRSFKGYINAPPIELGKRTDQTIVEANPKILEDMTYIETNPVIVNEDLLV